MSTTFIRGKVGRREKGRRCAMTEITVKERPILFSTPMVQAILEGRKTQTRRIVKPQEAVEYCDDSAVWVHDIKQPHPCEFACTINQFDKCPYGQPGDLLWVRETWLKTPSNGFAYKASHSDPESEEIRQDYLEAGAKWAKWKPSIHMPKAACRIWLEITDVRVELLQDISEDDAKAEGIGRWIETRLKSQPEHYQMYYQDEPEDPAFYSSCPKVSFESLWKEINGCDSWYANPWVWVIEFKKVAHV